MARLMRTCGLEGVRRGSRQRTTVTDTSLPRPPDLLNRHLAAEEPDRLWLADITYVRSLGRVGRGVQRNRETDWSTGGAWRSRDQVEFALLEWMSWYNHYRLHSATGNVPPAEYEAPFVSSSTFLASTGAT